MQLRIVLEYDEAVKAYSATIPELNYISSYGESKEAAIENLKEAIALLFEPIPDEFLGCGDKPYEIQEADLMELLPA